MCTAKIPDRNNLKLATVVILDIVSQPTDFGFKRAKVGIMVYGLGLGLGVGLRIGLGLG